jgi:hypothetical protein
MSMLYTCILDQEWGNARPLIGERGIGTDLRAGEGSCLLRQR